ncbi:MAG: branched-chain amino acid ABC transporter permease [Dehalococcoidia bacterium]|nr:branched-chain amino acid ABC transporter permease [Dehalococcoidia bacterium]
MRLPAPRRITVAQVLPGLAAAAVTAVILGISFERSGDVGAVVSFYTSFLTVAALLAIISLGLNIQWGYTGVFNFGVAAFFLVGAYTAAIVTKAPATAGFENYVGGFGEDLNVVPALATDQWFPFLVALLASATICGVLAFVLSIPTLRLREDYLAIAMIGVAELLRRITIEEHGLVNGTRALGGIPQPLSGLTSNADYKYIMLALALAALLLVFVALERGVRSPWGRVLRALREDELTTAASGKNVYAFKTQGFVLGAVIMGIGGAMFAFQSRAISPNTFTHFFATFLIWTMLIVGGSGNNRGAVLGAYVVWGFWQATQLIQTYDLPSVIALRISFIRDLTLGALIVIVLLLMPRGLLPEERRVSIWAERQVRRLRRPPRDGPDAPAAPAAADEAA